MRIPYRQLVEENRRPQAGAGVRAARHRHLRRRPLLRRLHRVRQGVAEDICIRDRGRSTAAPRRRRSISCRISGSATPGPGANRQARSRRSEPGPTGRVRQPRRRRLERRRRCATSHSSTAWAALSLRRAAASCSSPTTRRTRDRVSRIQGRQPKPYVKDAFHRHVINGEDAASTRTRRGTKACVHYRYRRCRQAAPSRCACASDAEVLRRAAAGRRCASSRQRKAEADEFYNDGPPADGDRRRADGAAAGARRVALDQADLPLRREPVAGRRQPPTVRRLSRGARPQQPLAAPQLHAHPVDAGQVGVPLVRRLGSGLPRLAAGAGRSRVRQGAALGPAVRAVPAPQRTDPGVRVGVLRPQPAGPRLGGLAGLQHRTDPHRTGRPGVSREVLPQAADQLRLVGEQGRQRRETTSSRAASSAWTTSPSSTAARSCPTAPSSSSPTRRAGWRCSAST